MVIPHAQIFATITTYITIKKTGMVYVTQHNEGSEVKL